MSVFFAWNITLVSPVRWLANNSSITHKIKFYIFVSNRTIEHFLSYYRIYKRFSNSYIKKSWKLLLKLGIFSNLLKLLGISRRGPIQNSDSVSMSVGSSRLTSLILRLSLMSQHRRIFVKVENLTKTLLSRGEYILERSWVLVFKSKILSEIAV